MGPADRKSVQPTSYDPGRKVMWVFLAVLVALQFYFVWELIAAFVLFTVGFVVLAGVAAILYVVDRASERGTVWARPHALRAVELTRRGVGLLEDLSRKSFRRPRSEPAQ